MSGVTGEDSTYAGEGVLSGIYKKASFSLGGFHFQTDGFRKNNDERDDIGNAFLQLELSPETSVQALYRYRTLRRDHPELMYFLDNFKSGPRNQLDVHTVPAR